MKHMLHKNCKLEILFQFVAQDHGTILEGQPGNGMVCFSGRVGPHKVASIEINKVLEAKLVMYHGEAMFGHPSVNQPLTQIH